MRFVRCYRAALVAAVGVGVATTASAHDEDWRKLADQLPRVEGPVWTYGDPVPRDGGGFDSSGITCLANIPLNNFAGTHASGNDCWGYVAPSGREYAIMGLQAGFGFVEITVPTAPVIVGVINGPNSTWHDIKVIGDYAYGVSEGGSGIQVIDLTDIDNGNVTLVQNKVQGGHTTTHNIASNPDSGFLYLCGANIANGGLVAVDTSNPADPIIAGSWPDFYVHDAQIVTYDSGPFAGREIAFCASGTGNGSGSTAVRIVDVTNKSNMFTVSTTFYPSASYSHQVWLSDDKQYLYHNDELDEGNLVATTTTRVIDVSDINSPSYVTSFTTGSAAIDHNLYVRDQYIFEANYRSGLRVFDATNPTAPVEIAYFDTFPGSESPNFNGAWSSYPFFPSGNVIVSDIERGLFVFRIDAIPSDFLDVSFQTPLPAQLIPGQPETVVARVVENNLTVGSVDLNISVNGGTPTQVVMTSIGGDLYEAQVPGQNCFDDVSVFVQATATDTSVHQSQSSDGTVFTSINVLLNDDAETDIGWSVGGTATDGQWDRGVPVNAGRGDPPSDADGSGQAWLTDNDAGNGGNSDVDNGTTTLTSPVFDLTGGATVSYEYWFADISGGPLDGDSFDVEISTDGGSNFTTVRSYLTAAPFWRSDSIEVGIETATSSTVVFRFTAEDVGNQNVVEGGLDAFNISEIICNPPNPACSPADVTTTGAGAGDPGFGVPDGQITSTDLNYYVNLWTSLDPGADLTTTGAGAGDPGFGVPDGSVTTSDLNYYVNLWVAGCP